jgi:hypothetical protein
MSESCSACTGSVVANLVGCQALGSDICSEAWNCPSKLLHMLPQACILHYTTTYLQLPKMSLPELLPMAFNYDNNTAKFAPMITYSEQFAVDDY